jgi:ATP-dependent Zn protease
VAKRFEKLGLTLMNRTRGSADFHADPVASVLQDPFKRAVAAQIIGQAFLTAREFVALNKGAVEKIANAVIEKEELYGDDLNRLLDSVALKKPDIDWTKEEIWPQM